MPPCRPFMINIYFYSLSSIEKYSLNKLHTNDTGVAHKTHVYTSKSGVHLVPWMWMFVLLCDVGRMIWLGLVLSRRVQHANQGLLTSSLYSPGVLLLWTVIYILINLRINSSEFPCISIYMPCTPCKWMRQCTLSHSAQPNPI